MTGVQTCALPILAFLGYALQVTLKHLLKRRAPMEAKPAVSGVDNAQPISPMKALALLSTLQSADIVLPITDGREIRLRRITEPEPDVALLLYQLKLTLPNQPPPRITALSGEILPPHFENVVQTFRTTLLKIKRLNASYPPNCES